MSSPSKVFECRWHASRLLLAAYLGAQSCALIALCCIDVSPWFSLAGMLLCLGHGAWVLPRQICLSHPTAITGLRRNDEGWQLWSAARGWQVAQLYRDSLALPLIVVLRFRLSGERRVRGICVPRDAMEQDQHRCLRVRLKFSRRRWAVPG